MEPKSLQAAMSFVPKNLAMRLMADPGALSRSSKEDHDAAIMFADISGFTPLTERLTRRGPSGAEDLTEILNAYFGRLVRLIHDHGGDIIKFAGDALYAIWESEDGELETVTTRAAQCAREIQQALAGYQAADDLRLEMKIGIGAGRITALTVGGMYGRWEYVMTGSPLRQMAEAEHHAAPGDVIMSKQAAALIERRCAGEVLEDGVLRLGSVTLPVPPRPLKSPGLPTSDEARDAILWFIPNAIRARLLAGQLASLAELRRITVLFINVRGFDYPPDKILEPAQEFMLAMQRALYRYEGSVNKLLVDDKGGSLIVVFGLPPLAHEDDALRACLSAQEMCQGLRPLGLHCAIGIATGQAFTGPLGSDLRREYAIMGDTVNLSARLMQAAWGPAGESDADGNRILCDEPTAVAASGSLEFQRLEPIRVKGKADLIPIFRPGAEVDPTVQTSKEELVGHEAEYRTLATSLSRLMLGKDSAADPGESRGSIVLIEGLSGTGKSVLVRALQKQARLEGARVVVGMAEAIQQRTPYFVWRSILRQLFKFGRATDDPAKPDEPLLDELRSLGIDTNFSPLLNELLGLELPETSATEHLEGQTRADRTHAFVASILNAHARTAPMLVVIENAQWLDSASWAQITELENTIEHVMLVVVARPGLASQSDDYRRLVESSGAATLMVDNLSREEMEIVVSSHLEADSLSGPLGAFLYTRAEGHPAFSIQLALALRDRGIIDNHEGEYRLGASEAELARLNVAVSVQGALTNRVDRLAPELASTLKTASVIGRTFSEELVQHLLGGRVEPATLRAQLATLAQFQLLETLDRRSGTTWAFKNLLILEVVYDLLLFSQRRELHAKVARSLEETKATANSVLAYHYGVAAGQTDVEADLAMKAIEHMQLAASEAARSSANVEAIELCSQAIELISKLPTSTQLKRQEFELQLALGPLLMATRGFAVPEVGEALRRAHELCPVEPSGRQQFSVSRGLWQFHQVCGELKQAMELARELQGLAERDPGLSLAAEANRLVGSTAIFRGEFEESLAAYTRGIEIYDDDAFFTAENPLVLCLSEAAWTLWLLGYPEQAVARNKEAQTRAEDFSDPFSIAVARYGNLILNTHLRRPEDIIGPAEELRALAIERDFGLLVAVAAIPKGWALVVEGQHERGLNEIRGGIATCEATGTSLQMTMFLGLLADALGHAGQHAEGLSIIAEAQTLAGKSGENWRLAELQRLEGELLLGVSAANAARAEECFLRSIDTSRSQHARGWELRGTNSLARLQVQRGQRQPARQALVEILDGFTEGRQTADLLDARKLLAELT